MPSRVRAAGAKVSATTGTATVAWPTHQANYIGILVVTSSAGGTTETLSTPAGFTLIDTQTTGSGTTGVKTSLYWCRATSSSMASPVVTAGSDFKYASIFVVDNCVTTGTPVIYAGGVKAAASTTATCPAVTTTVPFSYVINLVAWDLDQTAGVASAWTNSTIGDPAEVEDSGTTSGSGGGFSWAHGWQQDAGSTGTTTVTVTSSINTVHTLAFIPDPSRTTLVLDPHTTSASPYTGSTGTTVAWNSFNVGSVRMTRADANEAQMWRTLSGLTVGKTYDCSAWVEGWAAAGTGWLGVQGIGTGSTVSFTSSAFSIATYSFTATATSHQLNFFGDNGTSTTDLSYDNVWVDTTTEPADTFTDSFSSDTSAVYTVNSGSAKIYSSANQALEVWRASSGTDLATAARTLTGFTVGVDYTLTAKFKHFYAGETATVSVGILGIGTGTTATAVSSGYTTVSYTFTATSTAHTLQFNADGIGTHRTDVFVDDIAVALPSTVATGSGTATIRLAASGAGTKQPTNAGTATLHLAASGTIIKRVDGARTATLTLTGSGTADSTRSGTGTATMLLGATPAGSSVRTSSGTGTLALSASGVGAKTATGTATAPFALAGSGAATKTVDSAGTAPFILTAFGVDGDGFGLGTAEFHLTATTAGDSSRTGTGTATLELATSSTVESVRDGTGTAPFTLTLTPGAHRTHDVAATAPFTLTTTGTATTERATTRTATMWLSTSWTAAGERAVAHTASFVLTATGESITELTLRDISATGKLLPRRWGAGVGERNTGGVVLARDTTGQLVGRDTTGTLKPRRWEGHISQ